MAEAVFEAEPERFDAVVVGGGPRAVSLAERLSARLLREGGAASIAIVDAVEVGPGATWRTDQTPWFLNNTTSAATTIHPDASTGLDDVPANGETLVAWAARVVAEGGAGRPAWVLEEAREIAPASFPSRRVQGVYYLEQLARVEARGPLRIERVVGTVVDLDESPEGVEAVLADGRRIAAASAVLAQGMVQTRPDAEVRALADAAARHGLVYVAPGMPAERDWSSVPEGEDVIVRGLGANFFDVVAELTAGRGGRFEPVDGDPLGRLRYLPSGREPRIHAGSRRGVPYRSKPDLTRERPTPLRPRFATPEWFAELAERSPGSVDIARAVWPVVARDLAFAGLAAIEARHPGAVPGGLDEAEAALAALPLPHPADPSPRDAAERAIDEAIAARLAAPHRLRLDDLRRPTGGAPVGEQAWAAHVAALVEDELDSIGRPASSPRQAVNQAMSALRGPVARLAAAGVVEGGSRVRDLLGWFDADGLFLASGPPATRTRQVLALVEAGVVRLIGPETTIAVDEEAGLFVARSPISGVEVRARALAEARMSKGTVPGTDDPLLRALLDSGRARIHAFDSARGRVASASLDAVPPSAGERDGLALVDGAGEPSRRVLVLGIPASSTQPGSAIGASPGLRSPLLRGADLAARRVLALVASEAAPAPAVG
ncbi:FAD/NAD(P)-binding protein [Agrococcus terreus]|uniref:FAD/NAD(P)-binding protein n=1 Tax=Agrococcus terreus TaxID=574649 RepID=UPI00384DCC28